MPEKAFKEYGVPRTYWFILSSLLAAASSIMNAYATLDTLPMCSLITGVLTAQNQAAHGVQWQFVK
jgi:hypothetical protein